MESYHNSVKYARSYEGSPKMDCLRPRSPTLWRPVRILYSRWRFPLNCCWLFILCLFPDALSCRHLQQIGQEKNHDYPDGVYKINPTGSQDIMAYCDMSRDGGGWTLLVASHTNSWTAQNVRVRNIDTPELYGDYSILQHADSIKDNINVDGSSFEYRLEAQSPGNWQINSNSKRSLKRFILLHVIRSATDVIWMSKWEIYAQSRHKAAI